MSIIFDIIAVILIVMSGVSALKNGFMNTIVKKMAPLLSLFVAATGAKTLAPHFDGLAAKVASKTEPLQPILEYVFAFIVVFVLAMVILYIVAWLFKLLNNVVNKIPVLNIINKIVSVILGLFVGYISATLFVYLMNIIGIASDAVAKGMADGVIVQFIEDHSVFAFIAEKVAGLLA